MKFFLPFIKILFSTIALGCISSQLDFPIISNHISSFSLEFIFCVISLMLTQVFLGSLRWHIVIKSMHEKIPFLKIFQLFYIFLFFNVCLPLSAAAEASRVWFIKKQGISTTNAISSVLFDRLFGLIILLLLNFFVMPFIHIRFENSILFFMSLTISILSIAAFMIFITMNKFDTFWDSNQFLQTIKASKNQFTSFFSLKTRNCQLVLIISFFAFLIQSIIIFLLANRLHLSLSMLDCILFIPPVIFISSLPLSVAGWGLREGAVVFALVTFNIPVEQALTLSILLGLLSILIGIPGAIFWAILKNNNIRKQPEQSTV